jgi:hypothetical protein
MQVNSSFFIAPKIQAASVSRRLFLCSKVISIPFEASIYAIATRPYAARFPHFQSKQRQVAKRH